MAGTSEIAARYSSLSCGAAITEWKRFAYSRQLSYGNPISFMVRIAGTGLA